MNMLRNYSDIKVYKVFILASKFSLYRDTHLIIPEKTNLIDCGERISKVLFEMVHKVSLLAKI